MTGTEPTDTGPRRPASNPTRIYIIAAVLLLVVIVAVAAILITRGIPALRRTPQPTLTAQAASTTAPTTTAAPTAAPTAQASVEPTARPAPSAEPSPVMSDVDSPGFALQSAGARPSTEWTGFFGQVVDAQGDPLAGVPLVVWYPDGTAASAVVETDAAGGYEVRLADGVLAGLWSIQVLSDDLQPASKLQTFATDENSQTGIQQIQVIWQQVP